MTWLLNPRLLIVLALSVAWPLSLWTANNRGEIAGKAFVQQKWDAEATTRALATLKLVERAHATSQALQAEVAQQRKVKNAEINRLKRDHADDIDRMRVRSDRPDSADLPEVATVGAGGTGASLWRQDAEFLSGEALRADQLRLDLISCQTQYESAREAMK